MNCWAKLAEQPPRADAQSLSLGISGPDSSRERQKSQLLAARSQESPRTIIRRGTSTLTDTSRWAQTSKSTLLDSATAGAGLRLNQLSMRTRSSLSASESSSAKLHRPQTIAYATQLLILPLEYNQHVSSHLGLEFHFLLSNETYLAVC